MRIGSLIGSPARPLLGRIPADVQVPAPPFNESAVNTSAAAAAAADAADATRRNQAIDVVRFFAAAGIVFVHVAQTKTMDQWGNILRFAVPFYLFASLYFQSQSLRRTDRRRTLGQYIVTRVKRLYLPFLAWSVIYLLMRDAKRVLVQHLPPVEFRPSLLWQGTEYHLWFLPYLLGWSILLVVLYETLIKHDRRWRWPIIGLSIAAGLSVLMFNMPESWNQAFDAPVYGYAQFWISLPAACFALAFAMFMTMGERVIPVSSAVGYTGLIVATGAALKQAWDYQIEYFWRALTGLGTMLFALKPWTQTPAFLALARLGRYSYGIYLCHVIVVEVIHVIIDHAHVAPSPMLDIAAFALSFAGSLALVLALGRTPKLAWLNG